MTSDRSGPRPQAIAVFLVGLAIISVVGASYLSTSGTVDGPGTIGAPSGPAITIEGQTSINLTDPPDQGVLTLRTADGNATFVSSGVTNATINVDDLDGSWTNLTAIDAAATDLTVDAEGMANFTVGDGLQNVSVPASRSLGSTFTYGADSPALLRLQSVPASTTIGLVTSNGRVIEYTTSDASGQITYSSLTAGDYTVTMQTSDGGPTLSNPAPTGTIQDEGALSVDVTDPDMPDDNVTVTFYRDGNRIGTDEVLDNGTASVSLSEGLATRQHNWSAVATDGYDQQSNTINETFTFDPPDPILSDADPVGGISQYPSELSINISDPNFGLDSTHNVQYNISLDGTEIDNGSVTQNETVTSSVGSVLDAGGHTWTVNTTNEYGETTNATYQFSTPDDLEIRNESKPSELVKPTKVYIRFYFSDTQKDVYERNTTDGTVNMTGLPVGEPFIISADADTYRPRQVFAQSLFKTQTIYMLPDSEKFVESTFEMRDYTGTYPRDDSVLEIQRVLNGTWQTVEGGYFGATGQFPSQLQYNVRHRLILRNVETGQSRDLGTYTPLASGPQSVRVTPEGNISIETPTAFVDVSPELSQLPTRNSVDLSANIRNGTATQFDEWRVRVEAVNSTGATTDVLYTKNSTDPTGGSVDPALDLSGHADDTVRVNVSWMQDGEWQSTIYEYDTVQSPVTDQSLLKTLNSFIGLAAPGTESAFSGMLAMSLSIVLMATVASRYRVSGEMASLVGIGALTAFAIIGWITYNLVAISLIVWATLGFLRRRY